MGWRQLRCALTGHGTWMRANEHELMCAGCGMRIQIPIPYKMPILPLASSVVSSSFALQRPPPPVDRPVREFIGSVALTGMDDFGKWSFGGAEQGSDEFVITHVRFPVIPPEHRHLTLIVGRATFQLGAIARGAGESDGWIKLTFSQQFAKSDYHVFRFSSWSSEWPSLVIDVRAKLVRMP
jgi:hypothetical protein